MTSIHCADISIYDYNDLEKQLPEYHVPSNMGEHFYITIFNPSHERISPGEVCLDKGYTVPNTLRSCIEYPNNMNYLYGERVNENENDMADITNMTEDDTDDDDSDDSDIENAKVKAKAKRKPTVTTATTTTQKILSNVVTKFLNMVNHLSYIECPILCYSGTQNA
jgi:hypothetical protein